jgi:hypothetical protein
MSIPTSICWLPGRHISEKRVIIDSYLTRISTPGCDNNQSADFPHCRQSCICFDPQHVAIEIITDFQCSLYPNANQAVRCDINRPENIRIVCANKRVFVAVAFRTFEKSASLHKCTVELLVKPDRLLNSLEITHRPKTPAEFAFNNTLCPGPI